MEVNKEEAIRCLHIAQKHRNGSNLPSALKFAKKSVSLYSTPEAVAMVTIIEREIESGGSSSKSTAPSANGAGSSAKASGVEEHVTSARSRPGHQSAPAQPADNDKGKKREYTAKQMEVVKRVKSCKHHEYYEILAVEKTCSENEVKKAYKKLALALHPDKNGAPGADEAFKMVSKAFQVLSDENLRAAFDSNPHSDPTQRGGGMPSRSSGFAHPGFHSAGGFGGQDIDPAELFNMFFGGGGMGGNGFGGANVFTFGGPGGFQARYAGPQRRRGQPADEPTSPLTALLPMILLLAFAILTLLPNILSSGDRDPRYAFEPTEHLSTARSTWQRGVPYWVNQPEFEASAAWQNVPENRRDANAASYSSKLRSFERGVENVYIRKLQNECEFFAERQRQRINEASGFFGIGADNDKIARLSKEKSPACEQLRAWHLSQYGSY